MCSSDMSQSILNLVFSHSPEVISDWLSRQQMSNQQEWKQTAKSSAEPRGTAQLGRRSLGGSITAGDSSHVTHDHVTHRSANTDQCSFKLPRTAPQRADEWIQTVKLNLCSCQISTRPLTLVYTCMNYSQLHAYSQRMFKASTPGKYHELWRGGGAGRPCAFLSAVMETDGGGVLPDSCTVAPRCITVLSPNWDYSSQTASAFCFLWQSGERFSFSRGGIPQKKEKEKEIWLPLWQNCCHSLSFQTDSHTEVSQERRL